MQSVQCKMDGNDADKDLNPLWSGVPKKRKWETGNAGHSAEYHPLYGHSNVADLTQQAPRSS